eukprot:m.15981 g.15981  ORF g.15981 m.15981 type:complete len:249 (+) comp5553_c0_seq2:129-875(+)
MNRLTSFRVALVTRCPKQSWTKPYRSLATLQCSQLKMATRKTFLTHTKRELRSSATLADAMLAPVEDIKELYTTHGTLEYGERCSVNSHSVQAGLFAKEHGYSDEMIVAAFLHDIGHLAPLKYTDMAEGNMGDYGLENHEFIGEAYLKKLGFSDLVITTIRNHVPSKRYLVSTDKEYASTLSYASEQTLKYQGGPMNAEEIAAFESDPYFKESLQIRKMDELAKELDFNITQEHWDYLFGLVEDHLSK